MNPFCIIDQYYTQGTPLYNVLVRHSQDVARKALAIADCHPELNIDKTFVEEAVMLHDIGILWVDAPEIYCMGTLPYLAHGYVGHDLLLRLGFPRHALVCERHTGTGLSVAEIVRQKLPLPHRDMRPQTMEEQVICFADCFFSKSKLDLEKSPEKVRRQLEKFGEASVGQFDAWCKIFL